MGQALRRATGRVKSSNLKTPKKSSAIQDQNPEFGRHAPSESKTQRPIEINIDNWDPKPDPNTTLDPDALDRRDPGYDVMLNQMLGRIRVKPGGKSEMGEASVIPKYKRPMPKLQKSDASARPNEEEIVAPGTLNISQLRQILQLHEGKAENQEKPMDAKGIAEKFRVDGVVVQKILHYVSLPTESKAEEEGKAN
eukprot:Gb_15443 [translate_table: standard]